MERYRGSNWFDDFWGITTNDIDGAFMELAKTVGEKISPTYKVSADDTNATIHIAVPGFSKSNLDVNVENNILTVRGTQGNAGELESLRYFTKPFKLQWTLLPGKYDIEGIRTAMLNGILQITLPLQKKIEAPTKKVIPIN